MLTANWIVDCNGRLTMEWLRPDEGDRAESRERKTPETHRHEEARTANDEAGRAEHSLVA